jgi:hypothetical protein
MPIVTSGDVNGIKESIVATGGNPSSDTIVDLRDASTFSLFDPTYLDGATTLAEITNTNQFRGYGRDFTVISIAFTVKGNILPSSNNTSKSYLDFYKVVDNSLIGTASLELYNSTRTKIRLLGLTGSSTLCIGNDVGGDADGTKTVYYLNPQAIIATYGAFYVKIRGTLNGVETNITSENYPNLDYTPYQQNVNYAADREFVASPTGTSWVEYINGGGQAMFYFPTPFRKVRTWNGVLITETFSEYY